MPSVKRYQELGSALRVAREAAGMSQQEAALELGMGQTQLSRYESGLRQAPLHVIRKAEAVYENLILVPGSPSGVARGTPDGHQPSGERRRSRGYYEALLTAASRLSALAADMMAEANRGLEP